MTTQEKIDKLLKDMIKDIINSDKTSAEFKAYAIEVLRGMDEKEQMHLPKV